LADAHLAAQATHIAAQDARIAALKGAAERTDPSAEDPGQLLETALARA
jgi:hypothetical protein